MHYAVSKSLSEVRSFKSHLKDLKLLYGDLLSFAPLDIQVIFTNKLEELTSKYKQQETECSASSISQQVTPTRS